MSPIDDNKQNLLWFESDSMRGLYEAMNAWQQEANKRLLSVAIERDGDSFCCIALSNPTEVLIVDPAHKRAATINERGYLKVTTS